jgi:hypothetical protein
MALETRLLSREKIEMRTAEINAKLKLSEPELPSKRLWVLRSAGSEI